MIYRNDIDGLRAIAIIAILIFHIDPRFSGGFIGVDIFFVISGFLITGIIWRDLEKQRFSFSEFYLKRIRRLFPALFVTLFFSFLFVLAFGLNTEISMYGKSVLTSLYYISNVFFYTQNDYFASDLELNPLLHTWSLSVEEQFYLFFPIFIVFIYNRKAHTTGYLLILFILSLILSETLVRVDQSAAFFLSPSRFWQFLTGSFIAIYSPRIDISRTISEIISAIGTIFILISLLTFSKDTAFPGLNALIPTFATALLILGGKNRNSTFYKILSSAIPKFFGKISYSLYLWHWPIIVFYKISLAPTLAKEDKLILFTLSILLGYLSWKFIEQPTRNISITVKKRKIIYFSIVSMLVMTALGLTSTYTSLFFRSNTNYLESFSSYDFKGREGKCFFTSTSNQSELFDEKLCIKTGVKNNILLVGDSHAAHYYNALKKEFPHYNVSQATASGCRPITTYKGEEWCIKLMKRVFNELLNKYNFDTIILAGRWLPIDIEALNQTITHIESKVDKVLVFGPVVEYNQSLPILLARFGINKNEQYQIKKARNYQELLDTNEQMQLAIKPTKAIYIPIINLMCPEKKCITTLSNVPIQFDYGHLTYEGAAFLLKHILK